MAQRSNRRQPVYSADALALRYIGGLALAALGIMIFLAVELRMTGVVFDRLREVSYGLTGGLSYALPVLPIWAGVLVIWSSQKKAPVRPFIYALLGYLALCAFLVAVTHLGSEEYLAALSRLSDGSWGGAIHQGFLRSVSRPESGGAVGVALAFPFWNLTGTILSAAVLFLLTALCLMLALNLTPSRIRDLATGKISLRSGRGRDSRARQEEEQIAFQQEQERQRQYAMAQQAYYLQQQQQAQAAAMNAAQQGRQAPARQQDAQAAAEWTGVQGWQQDLTDQFAPVGAGRASQIFTGGEPGKQNTGRTSQIFGEAAQGKQNTGRASQIFGGAGADARPDAGRQGLFGSFFGKKKEQDDGLRDLSETEKRQEGMAYPSGGTGRTGKPSKERIRQEQIEADLDRWRENAETDPQSSAAAEDPAGKDRIPESPREDAAEKREDPVLTEAARPSGRKPAGRTPAKAPEKQAQKELSPWQKEVMEKEEEASRAKPAEKPEKEKKPEQVRIPVVQESIADPTWKPTLNNVTPKEPEAEEEYWEPVPYYAPPITDLAKPDRSETDTSREDAERSARLEQTLASFQVQARVVHVTHGPAISRFEMELASGTKVGKVAGLEKDIAYGMQATSVRIEAPIPGKSLVGVEVPNPKRAMVTLREILESPQMQNAKSILTVALGKDIAGTPIICDLAKMPHLLIAGATGSGKSVCINTIINSLLFRAGPDEVKLILVDPKVVELQCYNGIPHLLLPVVNDPHKAAAALAWAVAEMMERYDKFAERGVRNLQGYNAILKEGEKPMPRIVIIIDELADLMMVCKKDVEEYICRLTQLARAAGIHLIVATQRPSVDVITGLIKANIPSRIAFKTAQSVDSRTILDRNGSEQLLGQGDMLYLPTGAFAPTRVQGCFLSDDEVNRITDHVRQANPSTYDPDILDRLEQLSKGSDDSPGMDMIGGVPEPGPGDADLFSQAVEYAIADGQISTSTLQRRLKVGYARAGRLTDEMEERGIISAKDGSKPRKCLITRDEWEAMQASARGAAAAG